METMMALLLEPIGEMKATIDNIFESIQGLTSITVLE